MPYTDYTQLFQARLMLEKLAMQPSKSLVIRAAGGRLGAGMGAFSLYEGAKALPKHIADSPASKRYKLRRPGAEVEPVPGVDY